MFIDENGGWFIFWLNTMTGLLESDFTYWDVEPYWILLTACCLIVLYSGWWEYWGTELYWSEYDVDTPNVDCNWGEDWDCNRNWDWNWGWDWGLYWKFGLSCTVERNCWELGSYAEAYWEFRLA